MNVKRNHNLDLWQNKTDTTVIAEIVSESIAGNIKHIKGARHE